MNKKVLMITVVLSAFAMLATPLVSAKPWNYPKNNPKFEQFGTTINFEFSNLIAANYAATAGLEEANKVVVVFEEQPLAGYEIRIGEGVGMRTYEFGEDFDYSGVGTITIWDPILPYVFDPANPFTTLFIAGSKYHFRVDYMYDFSAFPGGLEGTITMLALVTGDSATPLGESKPMFITSLQGTGDFKNVQIQATGSGMGHQGVVTGWPEQTYILGDQDFSDGDTPLGVSVFNAASAGEPAPFDQFYGSNYAENFDKSWTFAFTPTGTIVSATLEFGIFDHDSAASGNQVAIFTIDGVDRTVDANSAFEGHGGSQIEENVYSFSVDPSLLSDGQLVVRLQLQGPGLEGGPGTVPPVAGETAYNGAGLDFSRLNIIKV